ncbi:MAG: DegV family protein [Actinobacteria bacterium]|nr:DegV family protein [Actinomycetota bacterium]
MEKLAIVTDSSADIPDELIKKYDIKIVPLYIHTRGKEFRDKIDITNNEIYELLYRDVEVKTSSPSPKDFLDIYKDLLENQGVNTIYSIHLSSKLSNTVGSARIAKSNLPNAEIEVFDSRTVTISTGLIVLEAAKLLARGEEKQKIKDALNILTERSSFYATVGNFEYIFRGGRVGGLKRFLNMALKVKPVFIIEDGKVKLIKITRTRKGSLESMIQEFRKIYSNKGKVIVAIFYGNDLEAAKFMNQQLKSDKSLDIEEIIFTEITPVIGTHSGPTVIGLSAVPSLF